MADYGFTHGGKVFTPNQTPDISIVENTERNKAIELAELEVWKAQPDRQFAYYAFPAENSRHNKFYRSSFDPLLTGAKVSTWLGTPLGHITYAHVWRHNFGGRMVSIMVRGNNGALYHGTASYDGGECINLRKNRR